MSRPPIGARRRRLVLESAVDEPDGFGGALRRYVPGPVLWGSIERLAGEERVRNGRAERIATHRIGLRYCEGVRAGMRLTAGPRRFAVRSAGDPDGRGRDLVLEVEELVEETLGETFGESR